MNVSCVAIFNVTCLSCGRVCLGILVSTGLLVLDMRDISISTKGFQEIAECKTHGQDAKALPADSVVRTTRLANTKEKRTTIGIPT